MSEILELSAMSHDSARQSRSPFVVGGHVDSNFGRLPSDTEEPSCVSGIQIYSRNTKSKNRKLPCFYCDQFFFHMSRHLLRKHGEETLVAGASVLSSGRNLRLQQVVNEGIYKHNVDVLKRKTGTLIIGRAPKNTRSEDDYLPCEFCLQFFVARELYRHCHSCKFRPPDAPTAGFTSNGRALLHGSLIDSNSHIDEALFNGVIQRMRIDKLTRVVKTDNLILQFGTMMLRKLGIKRALDISGRMRELARVVVQLQKDETVKDRQLSAFISGTTYDKLMKAIELEAQPKAGPGGRKMFCKPAFVTRVGSSLLKCANLKRGTALRTGDSDSLKQVDDFVSLHSMHFTDDMASAAHASYRMKGNHLDRFPDEDDLRLLRKYQLDKIDAQVEAAERETSSFQWRQLAEVTLSRMLVFNARRGSEAAELTLSEHSQVEDSAEPTLMEKLSPVEKELVQKLTVVNVVGKRSRPVPILLTPDMSKALCILCDTKRRSAHGICEENTFVFALPRCKTAHLNFYNTLQRVAQNAGLQKPKLISTTRMRKHLATMAQVHTTTTLVCNDTTQYSESFILKLLHSVYI